MNHFFLLSHFGLESPGIYWMLCDVSSRIVVIYLRRTLFVVVLIMARLWLLDPLLFYMVWNMMDVNVYFLVFLMYVDKSMVAIIIEFD